MTEPDPLRKLIDLTDSINQHALAKCLRLLNTRLPIHNKLIGLALLADRMVQAAEELAEVLQPRYYRSHDWYNFIPKSYDPTGYCQRCGINKTPATEATPCKE